MEGIYTLLEKVDKDPSLMNFDSDGLSLMFQSLDIAENTADTSECFQAVCLLERIMITNKSSSISSNGLELLLRLLPVGINAYSTKQYPSAEVIFRMLSEIGDTTACNNYAYMIRRHEITDPTKHDQLRCLKLLYNGVKERDAFSLVNTALVFALMIGDDEGWHLADSIFDQLSVLDGIHVTSWWEELEKKNDPEGRLVLFFLRRHGKIDDAGIDSEKSVVFRLRHDIPKFPTWISDEYAVETINDVMECIQDEAFDSLLDDFLSQMPICRDSVDELLKAVLHWDSFPIYHKLLTDFSSFLTREEGEKLKKDYQSIFDIPLPTD